MPPISKAERRRLPDLSVSNMNRRQTFLDEFYSRLPPNRPSFEPRFVGQANGRDSPRTQIQNFFRRGACGSRINPITRTEFAARAIERFLLRRRNSRAVQNRVLGIGEIPRRFFAICPLRNCQLTRRFRFGENSQFSGV